MTATAWSRLTGMTLALALTAVLTGPVLANGVMGGDSPPTRIPIPASHHKVLVEDIGGVSTRVSNASFDGQVFLYGRVGEADVSVPFEKIREVRFEKGSSASKVLAYVILRSEERVRVELDEEVPCYGETSFGLYRIPVEKIRRIEFIASSTPAPESD